MAKKIEKADIQLKDSVSPTVYDTVHETLKDNIAKLRKRNLLNKITKFQRDLTNYMYNCVYSWVEVWAKNRNYNRNQRAHQSNLIIKVTMKERWH